jgi:hypothetical protein
MEDLFRFATNYLEKLIHLIVPVPRTGLQEVERILGVVRLEAVGKSDRKALRQRQLATEIGGTAVITVFLIAAALFGFGIVYAALPPAAAPAVVAKSNQKAAEAEPEKAPPSAADAPQPSARAPVPAKDNRSLLDRQGLTPQSFWAMPPAIPIAVLLFMIAILGSQYVSRLANDPRVEDSGDFRDALRIWSSLIAMRRTTPRAVKRLVNRLRFLAMRARDLEQNGLARLPDPLLVTYALVEETSPTWIGRSAKQIEREGLPWPPQGDDAVKEEADMVARGLRGFEERFGNPYQDRHALVVYRAIAGLVEERVATDDESSKPDVKRPDAGEGREATSHTLASSAQAREQEA